MNNPNKEAQYLHSQAIWEQQQHTQTKIQELLARRQALLIEAMLTTPHSEAAFTMLHRKLSEANGITQAIKTLNPKYTDEQK